MRLVDAPVLKQLNVEVVGFERIKEERVMPQFWRDFWSFEARGDTGDRWFPTPG